MGKLDFWSQEHVEILRAFLRVLVDPKNNKLSEETVCQFIAAGGTTKGNIPSPRALRDFIHPDKPRDPRDQERLSVLLRWSVAYVQEKLERLHEIPQYKAALVLSERLGQEETKRRRAPTPEAASISTAIQLLSAQLYLTEGDFRQLQARLFRQADYRANRRRSERRFLCYRYHSVPGQVVKSFLALIGPNDDVPGICRFASFFSGSTGGERRANGVVLPMHNVTYLVGEVDEGAGLKIMAMRDLSTARTRYEGLILSLDDDLSSVAARIVLVPTSVENSIHADIGIKEEKALGPEFRKLRPMLQNRIDFSLNEDLLFDGKPIDQPAMVVKVGEALKDPATGRARLTDTANKEFNPAATRHYTFNAALPMWSARAKS